MLRGADIRHLCCCCLLSVDAMRGAATKERASSHETSRNQSTKKRRSSSVQVRESGPEGGAPSERRKRVGGAGVQDGAHAARLPAGGRALAGAKLPGQEELHAGGRDGAGENVPGEGRSMRFCRYKCAAVVEGLQRRKDRWSCELGKPMCFEC